MDALKHCDLPRRIEKVKGGVIPWSGLTPSERVNVRAVVPISANLMSFQDGVNLVEFVLAQHDVHGGEVFQDP